MTTVDSVIGCCPTGHSSSVSVLNSGPTSSGSIRYAVLMAEHTCAPILVLLLIFFSRRGDWGRGGWGDDSKIPAFCFFFNRRFPGMRPSSHTRSPLRTVFHFSISIFKKKEKPWNWMPWQWGERERGWCRPVVGRAALQVEPRYVCRGTMRKSRLAPHQEEVDRYKKPSSRSRHDTRPARCHQWTWRSTAPAPTQQKSDRSFVQREIFCNSNRYAPPRPRIRFALSIASPFFLRWRVRLSFFFRIVQQTENESPENDVVCGGPADGFHDRLLFGGRRRRRRWQAITKEFSHRRRREADRQGIQHERIQGLEIGCHL